jgi:hypothetical protein
MSARFGRLHSASKVPHGRKGLHGDEKTPWVGRMHVAHWHMSGATAENTTSGVAVGWCQMCMQFLGLVILFQ